MSEDAVLLNVRVFFAFARAGRLVMNAPTDLPDGMVELVPIDDLLAMADYAIQWSKDATINSETPDVGNNCQNFVSQALFAGGWPEVEANVLQFEDDSKWDGHIAFTAGSLLQETLTWRTTSHWMTFATNAGRVQWMPTCSTRPSAMWSRPIGTRTTSRWHCRPRDDRYLVGRGEGAAHLPAVQSAE